MIIKSAMNSFLINCNANYVHTFYSTAHFKQFLLIFTTSFLCMMDQLINSFCITYKCIGYHICYCIDFPNEVKYMGWSDCNGPASGMKLKWSEPPPDPAATFQSSIVNMSAYYHSSCSLEILHSFYTHVDMATLPYCS